MQRFPFWPPAPCNWLAGDSNIVCYLSASLGTNVILVGDLDVDYAQRAAEADVMRLATQAASAPPVPGGGGGTNGGGSGGDGGWFAMHTTNELWMELLVQTNSAPTLIVHTPESAGVYDLYFATNLATPHTWAWVTRTAPGQTNITAANLDGGQGYFILGTTNDADGDGLSDAYEKLVSGTDPETTNLTAISFALSLPHDCVNYRMLTGAVTVLSGFPTLMTVLVDPTNFDAAAWVPLDSTVLVDLGSTDGRKQVWVGLRGPLPNIEPAWQGTHVTLATAPPVLVITNPVSVTDSHPMIQVQGYSLAPLASLFFDVTNDAGASVLNRQGFVVDQHYDTRIHAFTTNYFQCFDISLAPGSNTITLRATDWAGNTALTNLTYVFSTNGDGTAPVITLAWPQDGMKLSGNSFTLRGRLDDPTAGVLAQIVSPDGTTNVVAGLVERTGLFWAEQMPLAAGTNTVTVRATDAAGNPAMTTLSVVQSDLELTMTAVPENQLHQLSLSLAGTVSAVDYTVWANGVQATMDEFRNWTADNVPVNAGGTASFFVTAYPPGENPGSGSGGYGTNPPSPNACHLAVDEDKPDRFYVSAYHDAWDHRISNHVMPRDYPQTESNTNDWADGLGGDKRYVADFDPSPEGGNHVVKTWQWPADVWTPSQLSTYESQWDNGPQAIETNQPPPSIGMEHCDRQVSESPWGCVREAANRSADGAQKYFTGGKAVPGRAYLVIASASATAYLNRLYTGTPFYLLNMGDPQGVEVPATSIVMDTFGRLAPNGQAAAVAPVGTEVAATTHVDGTNFSTVNAGAAKYDLRIYSGNQDVTYTNLPALVGQMFTLTCGLVPNIGSPPITNVQWTMPSTALSNFFVSPDNLQTNGFPVFLTDQQKTSNTVRFCWVDGGAKWVTCKVKAEGLDYEAGTTFRVKRPNATLTATIQAGVEVWHNRLRFQNNFIDGITFMPRDEDTLGDWQYIQIGHQLARYQDAAAGTWSREEGSGLDTVYPNPLDRDSPSTDLPADGSVSVATVTGTFTTYLAFRPTPSDVLIPIREITWSWDGHAATNGNGEWVGGGTAHVDPEDGEAPATISWTNNMLTTLTNRVPEN